MTGNGEDTGLVSDYQPEATWSSDWQVLKSMLLADVKGETQQERLESFYESQADLYDSYRCRMLHGRLPMVRNMPAPKGGVWVDLGGGTGANLEFFGKEGLRHWSKCYVLDFCPSLVATARKRVIDNDWNDFVEVILGDACDHQCASLPKAGTVDVVTFSYALSMIPDWQEAIRNAWRLLKPGGSIAVCDFTVSEDQWPGMSGLWTWIFSNDHVHLKSEHLTVLNKAFEKTDSHIGFGAFPYIPPCLVCPYYYFVGRKNSRRCPI